MPVSLAAKRRAELDDLVEMDVGIDVCEHIGPFVGTGQRDRHGPLADRETIDRFDADADVSFDKARAQRLDEPGAGSPLGVRRRATGHADKNGRLGKMRHA